jgi:hypothetical protein
VKTPKSAPTPNWKSIILTTPEWPENLVLPQNDPLPEDSESILESIYTNEHWDWELWRDPDGHQYFLKVWPVDKGKYNQPKTPGVALTLMETFQFLMTNWMPRDVIADLTFECPKLLKSLQLPSDAPGLN